MTAFPLPWPHGLLQRLRPPNGGHPVGIQVRELSTASAKPPACRHPSTWSPQLGCNPKWPGSLDLAAESPRDWNRTAVETSPPPASPRPDHPDSGMAD